MGLDAGPFIVGDAEIDAVANPPPGHDHVVAKSAFLGGAGAPGLLLGLDAGQMEHALGPAASGACDLSSHHLEPWHQIKSLNPHRVVDERLWGLTSVVRHGGLPGDRSDWGPSMRAC
jgi:hypothetical protein